MKEYVMQMVEAKPDEGSIINKVVYVERSDHTAVVEDFQSDIKVLKWMLQNPDSRFQDDPARIQIEFNRLREWHYFIPQEDNDRFCKICGRYLASNKHVR